MSDDRPPALTPELRAALQRPQSIEFKITFDPGGAVNISGPLKDKMLCYALLQVAMDQVREFNDGRVSGLQTPPPNSVIV